MRLSLRARGFAPGEGERGQAVVLTAITLTALLMFAGLAIDAGQLYVARRTMQEAADAGAYAGAVVLYQGGTETDAATAAAADVLRNGYQDGGNGGLTTVVTRTRPASGPHANDPKYVEVIVTDQVRTVLLPGQGTLNTVRVRAVAGAEPLNNGYAIMALDRGNTPSAMYVGPNSVVALDGAGILVNATAATAADHAAGGSGSISVINSAIGTDVAGGTAGAWPAPISPGIQQKPDPFAGYPKPSVSGMTTYTSLPGAVGSSPPTITLDPGIYTVSIDAAGGTKVVMNTGIYILKAGINGTGNADIVSGAGGVFIFNTVTGYPASTGTCTGIKLAGNAASDLQPLASGTYKGLLFYQDAVCDKEFKIGGNGSLAASGSIYLPNAQLTMDGSNATLSGSQLVAKRVFVNNGTINVRFDAGTTAQPVLPRLAE